MIKKLCKEDGKIINKILIQESALMAESITDILLSLEQNESSVQEDHLSATKISAIAEQFDRILCNGLRTTLQNILDELPQT